MRRGEGIGMDKKRVETIKELKSYLRKIRRKYAIKKMILFGSAARGKTTKHSDLDIILVSAKFRKKSALKRPVPFYLEWDLRRPVDIICYTPEEFESLKNRVSLVREALREGIEIKV